MDCEGKVAVITGAADRMPSPTEEVGTGGKELGTVSPELPFGTPFESWFVSLKLPSNSHEATRVHEYILKELADHLGLHYSAISVIVKSMDERREHHE